MKRHRQSQAEALAWPFVAPAALRSAALGVSLPAVAAGLRDRWPALGGGDQAREIARRVWGADGASLLDGLMAHAQELLAPDGEELRLIPDRQHPGREILRWRWLSLALPPSLLMAAATPRGGRAPRGVRVLDRTLTPAGPIAHLHLHASAAAPFALLWSRLMTTLEVDAIRQSPLGPDAPPWEWHALLRRAALARVVLARYRHRPGDLGEDVGPFRHPRWGYVYRRAVAELIAGRVIRRDHGFEVEVRRLVTDMRPPGGAPAMRREPGNGREVFACDPIGDGGDHPELPFLATALRAAREGRGASGAEGRGSYQTLLVQYLRIQCLTYRDIVVDPREVGLGAFVKRFDRMKTYALGLDGLCSVALAADGPGLDIQAIEVRDGPPKSLAKFRRRVKALGDAGTPVERGVVYHLIRNAKAQRRGPPPGGRAGWAAVMRQHERAADGLIRALRRWPGALTLVRGLDVASDEVEGPLWLAAPALRRVLAVATRAASRCGVPNLRLTLHVGEDFRSLAAGLRAIHEPFELGLMQREDRLGHALALGLDITAWCRDHRSVVQPRWERALDLAWMLDVVGTFKPQVAASGATLRRLEDELAEHGRVLGASPALLRAWRRLLLAPDGLASVGFPRAFPPTFATDTAQRVLVDFLYRDTPDRRARFDAPVEVASGDEVELLTAIADALAGHLAAWQTVIEVNPTSNLLIGDLDHPLSQPMFRLRAIDSSDGRHLQVVLSTDDPTMMATNLADEFAYAWAGAVVAGGVAPGFMRRWLDDAAATSWRARFTRPESRR